MQELGVMDVAVADKVVQHDMNTTPLGDPVGLLSGINEVYLPTDEKMCRLLGSCLEEKEFIIILELLRQEICLSAHRSRRQRSMSVLMPLPVRWKVDRSDMYAMSIKFRLPSFALFQMERSFYGLCHLCRESSTAVNSCGD